MKTLAIETSCDDTSVAIVSYDEGDFLIDKMLSYSQIALHKKYGGVVPELAARSHQEKIIVLLDELNIDKESIDTISVTAYPGLPGALVVGVTTAYMLGSMRKKPVIEVNHIMGHVFSILAGRSITVLKLPYLCLTVSGGHNDIYLVEKKSTKNLDGGDQEQRHKRNHMAIGESINVGNYRVKKVAQSTDDAAGEAFDKVSRMLGGPNPGGKWVSEYADNCNVDLPRRLSTPQFKNGLFSFSGIKSQANTLIKKIKEETKDEILLEDQQKQIAYDFQEIVAQSLVHGLCVLHKKHDIETVGIVGGVSANLRLREVGNEHFENVVLPEKFEYCTDNAAMIGVVGLLQSLGS